MIEWKRIPRQGFVASHWIGTRSDGVTLKIYQRIRGGRSTRTVQTYMGDIRGKATEFPNVAAAKRHAEAMP